MAAINKLSALAVQRQKTPGRYGDGGGLWLQVSANGGKSWLFRYTRLDKARHMGLGPIDIISLADARELARDNRRKLLEGKDPLESRDTGRRAIVAEAARGHTFTACADAYMAAHESGWKNPKHAAQWRATLQTYAYPIIGDLRVSAVDTDLVMKIVEPLWSNKAETASRLRGRIESVLDWATAKHFRVGDNPARWRGHLDKLLPARSSVAAVKHHQALAYKDIPKFMAALRARDSLSARALELTILTASRTSEVTGARWSETDLSAMSWMRPAERMKAKKEHRVPLSARCVSILESLRGESLGVYVFPGSGKAGHISNMAMLELLQGISGFERLTVHGFRSTFTDWAHECTDHSKEVVDIALAHTLSDKVEAAYRRGDMFAKRRALAEDWASFCGSEVKC